MLGQRPADDQADMAYTAAVITVVVDPSGGAGVHPGDLAVLLHGAGTWEALVLAEALVDAADRERRRRLPICPGPPGPSMVVTFGDINSLSTVTMPRRSTPQGGGLRVAELSGPPGSGGAAGLR